MSYKEANAVDDPAVTSSPPSSSDHHMTTVSHHNFGDSSKISDAFSITIIESMKEDYGLFVWPCSIVLAEYVWQQRLRFSSLGAGTSLPGLVAAKLGSDVTLTDDTNRPEVLANMRRVSELNNLNCEISSVYIQKLSSGLMFYTTHVPLMTSLLL
ncbi:Methyltransferase-like protein [Actinidia chinensis var. chinensis]|uniref:Methyltransferase-like protein n=1 Tax=Actinidia chinensis var. chinensis TaxID=1590841 RepID=A0A2R6S2R1_ACTCC|nr:Methyltransferase-like protein [Actinidia chinensis var. chinensis]